MNSLTVLLVLSGKLCFELVSVYASVECFCLSDIRATQENHLCPSQTRWVEERVDNPFSFYTPRSDF